MSFFMVGEGAGTGRPPFQSKSMVASMRVNGFASVARPRVSDPWSDRSSFS